MSGVDFFTGSRPRVFGHRGAGGEAPENTLLSFERALECGVDVLELDVHASRDGAIVVIHDATLDRTTDGTGAVCEHTLEELRRLDAGYRFTADGKTHPFRGAGAGVSTLAEVLAHFPKMRFNIEVKQGSPRIVDRVLDLISDQGCGERVLLAAEKDDIMRDIRSSGGSRVCTGFAAGEVADFIGRVPSSAFDGYDAPGRALQIPVEFGGVKLVTPETLAAAHRLGLEMHVWTINDRAEMDRLLALGVDGIMSDLPALARAAADAVLAR